MTNTTIACSALLAVCVALVPSPGLAQSFDCAKAGTDVERTICANSLLIPLDEELARTYRRARSLAAPNARENLIKWQRTWLARRESCGTNDTCLYNRYITRLKTLAKRKGVFAGWGGSFTNWADLNFTIKSPAHADAAVTLSGADANYICDGEFKAKVADDGLSLTVSVDGNTMTFHALGTGMLVPDDLGPALTPFPYCGARAPQLGGFYARD